MVNKVFNNLKEFWKFLNKDSWQSTLAFISIFLIFVMFIFSPLIGMLTGFSYSESVIKPSFKTSFPFISLSSGSMNLVIVESCSMYHRESLEGILENELYSNLNIDIEDTKSWDLRKGFNKGDIIFSIAAKNLEVGDVIIFDSGQRSVRYPIIHRIIKIDETLTTKGDNNYGLLEYEKEIPRDSVFAKSIIRIPYVGWIKLIFFDWQKSPEQRGLCK
jgi:signal peptidase I